MIFLNAVFCLIVAYVSFAFLAHRHPPKLPKEILMQCGLAVVFAFAVFIAFIPLRAGAPHWWTVTFRGGIAVVLVMLYDMEFGLYRHWRMLVEWANGWKRKASKALSWARGK